MPIPAWVAGFLIVNVGGAIIKELLFPSPLADDDLDSVYPNRPKPIDPNNNNPRPNDNLPQNNNPRPTIYFPPVRCYELPDQNNNLPQQPPPRRLPQEGNDQSATLTPIGQVFTIKEWIEFREFGKLLWNPLNEQPLTIRQGFNKDADVQFNAALEEGIEDYRRWLFAQLNPEYKQSKEYLDLYSFWDGTAWIFPERLKGFQGDLSVNFGMKALQRLGEVMSLQSENCLYGIIDSIPNGYEIVLGEFPETEEITDKLKDLEIIGDQVTQELLGVTDFPITVPKDLTGLPSFEEFKNAGIDERTLDENAFNLKDGNKFNTESLDLDAEKLEEQLSEEYKNKYYQKINSLTEFVVWQMKQLDGLLGAFPIDFEITDNDLLEEGDQTLRVSLPNIAETLAELMGNSINQEKYTDVLMNLCLRILMESGSIKSLGVINNSAIESVVDYLGFKIERKEKEVDFTFNPGLETEEGKELDIAKFLEPQKIKMKVEEYDDEVTLETQLLTLLEAAKIVKGALTRRVNVENDAALKSLFKNSLDVLNTKDDDNEKSKLDKWLEKFEDGFTNEPNIKDPTKPWGRDRNQRPRIRKLNNDG